MVSISPAVHADREVAARAAARAGVVIRQARGSEELREVSELFAAIWGTELSASPGPRNVLSAIADTGGYVAGAWRDTTLVGASFGMTYLDGEVPCLRSQVTGTTRPGHGIGEALKRDQRAWAVEHGMGRITWTFDPLVRRNARFNLGRLGARIVRFVPDFYGSLDDGLNGREQTDRCVVSWELASECEPGAPVEAAVLVAAGHGVLLGAEGDTPLPGDRADGAVLVATPADIVALRRRDLGLAAAWRSALHDAFVAAFDAGLESDLVTSDGWYRFRSPQAGS